MSDLKPCAWCEHKVWLESNRDWHRIIGNHSENCIMSENEAPEVPATDEQLSILVKDWNARPAEDLLKAQNAEMLEELTELKTALLDKEYLAVRAEPTGLALVPLEVSFAMTEKGFESAPGHKFPHVRDVYDAMVKEVRIKPKQAARESHEE